MTLQEKINNRLDANKGILAILENVAESFPTLRFGQLLWRLGILKFGTNGHLVDIFHEESVDLLEEVNTNWTIVKTDKQPNANDIVQKPNNQERRYEIAKEVLSKILMWEERSNYETIDYDKSAEEALKLADALIAKLDDKEVVEAVDVTTDTRTVYFD